MIPKYFAPSLYILCHFLTTTDLLVYEAGKIIRFICGKSDVVSLLLQDIDVCCGSWCAMKCCWLWIHWCGMQQIACGYKMAYSWSFSSWKVVEAHYFSFALVLLMMLLAKLQGFLHTQEWKSSCMLPAQWLVQKLKKNRVILAIKEKP